MKFSFDDLLLSFFLSNAIIYGWQANHGAEVDLIIKKNGRINAALEIKSSALIS